MVVATTLRTTAAGEAMVAMVVETIGLSRNLNHIIVKEVVVVEAAEAAEVVQPRS